MFDALLIDDSHDPPRARPAELDDSALPEGAVTLAVAYSSLNYKDALAVTGSAPVARKLPLVAGVDLAGTVVESSDPAFSVGDEVLATGHGLGERHWGGFAQKARLDGGWLTPLPTGLSLHEAMAIGTAGLTAMLCTMALEDHGIDEGDLLVTGASGGVGSFAITILSSLGRDVVASTGRPQEADFLRALGAKEVVDRDELAQPGRALGKERWAGAVDAVGGQTLANICSTLRYGAAVAACGNAGGMGLPASVAPFILRGVSLIGVDSVEARSDRRAEAWSRLTALDSNLRHSIVDEIGLSEVLATAEGMLAGKVRGRLIVDTNR